MDQITYNAIRAAQVNNTTSMLYQRHLQRIDDKVSQYVRQWEDSKKNSGNKLLRMLDSLSK